MTTVIGVENVSKKYIIGHQNQGRYLTLRDTLAEGVKSMGKHLLKLRDKTNESFEEFWALNDISFEVKQGEKVGIIGRNGAGKSTLLKVLSRITEPTSGRIKMNGRVASLLEVGTGFHPELTGRENIFLNGAILGMTKAEIKKKFDEIVEFAEVEKFLDTPVKRYSSGMYVRLAFSVAAHLEPEILIVDEVLAVGDAQFQKKCLGKMSEVGSEGRTVLFVSHNLTAIKTLCDRAVLLEHGRLIVDKAAAEVIGQYMGGEQQSIVTREWHDEKTAPHTTATVLNRVALTNSLGRAVDEIYIDNAFNIEIEYTIRQEGVSVGLTVIVYDQENNCVFSSINNLEKNWYGKPMPEGVYKSICQIPANFLNNGWFSLSINLFGKGFSDSVMTNEILRFEALDSPAVRGDYFGIFGGVIRPLLNWETNTLGTKEQ